MRVSADAVLILHAFPIKMVDDASALVSRSVKASEGIRGVLGSLIQDRMDNFQMVEEEVNFPIDSCLQVAAMVKTKVEVVVMGGNNNNFPGTGNGNVNQNGQTRGQFPDNNGQTSNGNVNRPKRKHKCW